MRFLRLGLTAMFFLVSFPALGMAERIAAASVAAMACGPRDSIVRELEGKHHEVVGGMGISKRALVEIFASPGGSFTVLLTTPKMVSCIMATGKDWSFRDSKDYF